VIIFTGAATLHNALIIDSFGFSGDFCAAVPIRRDYVNVALGYFILAQNHRGALEWLPFCLSALD